MAHVLYAVVSHGTSTTLRYDYTFEKTIVFGLNISRCGRMGVIIHTYIRTCIQYLHHLSTMHIMHIAGRMEEKCE